MSSYSLHEKVIAVCAAIGGVLIAVWFGVRGAGLIDWNAEARPAVDALLAGHGAQFLQLAPAYGGSLILRSPFILSTKLWHGGSTAVYLASAAPCLAAAAALGIWLSAQMRKRGAALPACVLVILLSAANPLSVPALQFGHPEELLGAVLCIAAVLCAMSDRPIWAAVLLGLAIANKEWAVLAVGPVLVALPRARVRSLLISGAVAAPLLAPLLLAPALTGASAASTAATGLNTGTIFQPWQIWWFFGSHAHVVKGLHSVTAGFRTAPAWIQTIGHPLVVLVMAPLTGLFAWLRRLSAHQLANGPLLLLTLLFALRCVLDPWDTAYYAVPFVLSLLMWESLSFDRPPVLSLMASFAAWIAFRETGWGALNLPLDGQALIFALVSVPSIIALGVRLYAPGVVQRLVWRPGRDQAMAPAGWPYATTQKAGAGT